MSFVTSLTTVPGTGFRLDSTSSSTLYFFASSMGIGIVFSGLSVLAVEGVMTLLASLLTGVLTDAVITEISVTGSLMIIGITLNVLGVTKLRILNMTPALLLPVLLCKFM